MDQTGVVGMGFQCEPGICLSKIGLRVEVLNRPEYIHDILYGASDLSFKGYKGWCQIKFKLSAVLMIG